MKADRRCAVVIDTNVWISAALSQAGAPALLVRQVLHAIPVFSRRTFEELETRLWRPRFDRYLSMELRSSILHDLGAAACWVEIPPSIAAVAYSRDKDDDHFIHSALAAGAAWLVSGDQDLLSVQPPGGMRIITPAKALTLREFNPQVTSAKNP